ncbi:BRCT domain-containing protein [Fimbriiglobus ruber]|uniref:BRCT domain-containing protein n=1 Tax=Fimbriiglobus ruber TaxID=1908690 RepID=A0A225E6J5_9BACT|nr:BRCT domain-containing protein [Fimbriiglobus ruber]OWK47384.1 hypothetical protein FRUB_01083 [Fimbriiglobus ruber]
MAITLADVRRAWDVRDPELPRLVARLAEQDEPHKPVRSGALTFDQFLYQTRTPQFRKKSKDEQAHARIELMKTLEAPDAEVPLSDRLRLHEIILALWQTDDPFARSCLLEVIATVPLKYGPWRALKRIFKESEAVRDTEVFGALAARIDKEYAGHGAERITPQTMAYLARRAWRFLRRVGVQLPATYADTAVDFLVRYPDDTAWRNTWIANHIFFHQSKQYGKAHFHFGGRNVPSPEQLKDAAYRDLWKRSPRPLFTLLERARADAVRGFAAAALKADFRAVLRDVEPVWVVRLVGVQSKTIDEFVIWLLQNVPTFEQGNFRTNGLHDAVLRLLDSPADSARVYAANYARTHARDLPVSELVRLANNSHEAVRKLAQDLIGERDPRKDVGLAAWGELLETEYGYKFAAAAIPQYFGAAELTPAWFADRLLSGNQRAFEFAKGLLPKIHPTDRLGSAYFLNLLKRLEPTEGQIIRRVIPYAAGELARFDLNAVAADGLRWLALFPGGWPVVARWVDEGKLKPQTLGVGFWKALAFQPDWEADPDLAAFRAANGTWAGDLPFDEPRARQVLAWLGDVRKFAPGELGFDWLMRLVARTEPLYHDFAVDTMIRSFTPADFAPREAAPSAPAAAPTSETVDLQKASFLFTGKLSTMTREEAEAKVKAANGAVAGSVTKNLHYLVIGDDGSPLYGQGKKGSKQVKAEQLNEAGANVRIISETLFLQMLVGRQPQATGDASLAGCERLWEFVIAPGPADAPVGRFARQYVRRHHPLLGQKLDDKPVDPGAEVPQTFLTYDRVAPLFAESRRPLREFALELAGYEFARWSPTIDQLVAMTELPFADVRRFVAKVLLADDAPENRLFRLDPARLEAAAVYRFCESADDETRALGMELISRLPQLRVPEELFRLTESPDRRVRAFVIRALWAVYRDRGVMPEWKPPVPPKPQVGATARKAAERQEAARGMASRRARNSGRPANRRWPSSSVGCCLNFRRDRRNPPNETPTTTRRRTNNRAGPPAASYPGSRCPRAGRSWTRSKSCGTWPCPTGNLLPAFYRCWTSSSGREAPVNGPPVWSPSPASATRIPN